MFLALTPQTGMMLTTVMTTAVITMMMPMMPAFDDAGAGWGRPSESGLVALDLHHDVVDVDELVLDLHALEGVVVQDLLEAVVVLDQLHQGPLRPITPKKIIYFL